MSKGLSHAALGQLDKHSDEHALQRVSTNVIEACTATRSLLRTDVPDLVKPWFSSDHEKIVSPLFITVSTEGV